jgi:hypothetical protein
MKSIVQSPQPFPTYDLVFGHDESSHGKQHGKDGGGLNGKIMRQNEEQWNYTHTRMWFSNIASAEIKDNEIINVQFHIFP